MPRGTTESRDFWTCPNCRSAVSTRYCPGCGEAAPRPRDLTLRGLAEQAAAALTSIDGRILRSFRSLVIRPGELTVAYLGGRRKPFIAPFQLFLLANVFFFAMQSLTGVKIFSTTLESHLHSQDWSEIAQRMVSHRLAGVETSLDRYAPVFDQAVAWNAKSLVILMVLPFALLPFLLYRKSGHLFVAHVTFSLHFYTFLLLILSFASVVPAIDERVGGAGLASAFIDRGLALVCLVLCSVYLHVASGRVYGASGSARVLKVLALTVAVACLVLGYRFLLLPITLYST